MPKFEVTSPQGAVFEIDAPEGATEQDAVNWAQQNSDSLHALPITPVTSQTTTPPPQFNMVKDVPPDWFAWALPLAIVASIPVWRIGFKGTVKLIAKIPSAIGKLLLWILGAAISIYVIGGIAGLFLFGWRQF